MPGGSKCFVNMVKRDLAHFVDVAEAAAALRARGMIAVPHLPACRFDSAPELQSALARLSTAGCTELLLLGGNDQHERCVSAPCGVYSVYHGTWRGECIHWGSAFHCGQGAGRGSLPLGGRAAGERRADATRLQTRRAGAPIPHCTLPTVGTLRHPSSRGCRCFSALTDRRECSQAGHPEGHPGLAKDPAATTAVLAAKVQAAVEAGHTVAVASQVCPHAMPIR